MSIDTNPLSAELESTASEYKGKHRRNLPEWTPYMELGQDTGEIQSRPMPVSDTPVEDAEILAQFDVDPDEWEITARRRSMWQQREDGPFLESHRVSLARRGSSAALLTDDIITKLLKPYVARSKRQPKTTGSGIMLLALGDLQVGKREVQGRGTPELIERFGELTASAADEIKTHGRLSKLVIIWAGDCLEGTVSQGGRLALLQDLTVTEQLRMYRRLLLHQLGVLAPLADAVVVVPIAGNHDMTTRQFVTPPTDSWALEGASAVQDALKLAPEQFGHVQFAYPAEGEISSALNVGTEDEPFVIGATHGHVCGSSPNHMTRWWADQTHGQQPVAEADILVSGHFHHARLEATGAGKWWLQVPAMDSGSDWYRHKRGENAPAGMVTMLITPGRAPGWDQLRIHSREGDA